VIDTKTPRAVQTSVAVERHTVTLRLVLVATNAEARALERSLQTTIAAKTGVVPTITVTAVPDASTLAAATMDRAKNPNEAPSRQIDVEAIRQRLGAAIDVEWPTAVAGPLAGWELVVPSREPPTVIPHHLGAPLGDAGAALLASRWSSSIGATVRVRDDALQHADTSRRLGREREWFSAAAPLLAWVAGADRAVACISAPVDSTRRRTASERSTLDSVRHTAAAKLGRVVIADSAGWRIRVAVERCSG
jgi:hypothetical protein